MKYYNHNNQIFIAVNSDNDFMMFQEGDEELSYGEDIIVDDVTPMIREAFYSKLASFLSKLKPFERDVNRELYCTFDMNFIPYKMLMHYELDRN